MMRLVIHTIIWLSINYEVYSSAGTLVISFIGMQSQEVKIKSNVNVVLKSDAEQLDEVMVVAYGTAKSHHLQEQPLLWMARKL